MKQVLGKKINFCVGRNVTRQKISDNVYSLDDFYNDLYGKNGYAERPDERCVVSLTKNKAAVLSPRTADKSLSSIFLLCEMDTDEIDPWYFSYIFNEDKDLIAQMNKLQQGTIGCMAKLNVSLISSLMIDPPSIERQKIIGKAYREILLWERLNREQIKNRKIVALETLNKMNMN